MLFVMFQRMQEFKSRAGRGKQKKVICFCQSTIIERNLWISLLVWFKTIHRLVCILRNQVTTLNNSTNVGHIKV